MHNINTKFPCKRLLSILEQTLTIVFAFVLWIHELNLRSNYFISIYYNAFVKQIIYFIFLGLWKSKIYLRFINTKCFSFSKRYILLSITVKHFWTFSFRFAIETIRYRSFIIEELVLSLTSLLSGKWKYFLLYTQVLGT